ncbi:MAG: 50S ribosomal protein L6 [Candidatus Nealsonbacteria bacterium CG_4_9_14_0_2_um_filter_37_38]|uniref:Large ribosomal subunit protein uL6 n=1 Tax=Candidatus Nealsonbacteria bacterium CG_4_10_14_0_8_um_filter_37_14 TaxID=1974684 RepID=A0A2M7R6N1_9BACT|nr:MAG: 50S ribosomal protein L6 [Candidatus Nealsonbacteria bacterium CG11_big_fil_rev_8_21_14_0_20_37_68]PIW91995.1 MAG: 50S ribosomal protein L6 [Candidatus Nealsonbacteria bacterium CG_4_8_14_3_um_filter_37_23]PIY88980.1 MAG: 50S ribosomal protein L6 [Candidatus Nealsonbacteria bacterium CG_4_10_14_0_8_um_filter_37_14]PJC51644.1 MAG: 50S ribosomal protein L6 [Candidatus Nealsonbacteria bacterium CG_4_9_14_0_2_um_filter_37_38]
MSRIGKKPILIPENVEVKIEGQKVTIKGPKGELSQGVRPEIKVEVRDNQILVFPQIETKPSTRTPHESKIRTGQASQVSGKQTKALWGLTRALIANLVKGVTEGYEKKLEISGLGYRANLDGKDLVLELGFSHPVKVACPPGIIFLIGKNIITVLGIDKQLVGQTAAKIRKAKPPEPYKDKGIKYLGEVIRRKAGKKAVGTTG